MKGVVKELTMKRRNKCNNNSIKQLELEKLELVAEESCQTNILW